MLTLNDIINVSFRRSNFSGYRTEDVDNFIDQVKDSFDQLIKKTIEQKEANEALTAENLQLTKKLEVLANKIEEYRAEEDEIKNALVSAQKLGDASVREARHKAEIIIKDASLKAERIIGTAKTDVVEEQKAFEELKKKVADFRTRLLGIYKEHLTMIDAIPAKKEEEAPETPEEETAQNAAPDNAPEPDAAPEPPSGPPVYEPAGSFSADAASFETKEPQAQAERDLRYDVLKFGEDYDISEN